MANGYGGVQVDGGSATISTSDLSGNTGYGALATGGALVNLNDNTIDSTAPDEMGDGSDGIGVRAEDGSEAHLSGNQISGNALVNVWADSSDLSMSGDVVVGALYGIAALNGQVELSEVSITDSYLYGMLASSQAPVTVQGCTVYGDPDATQNVPDDEDGDGYAEWGGEEYGYSGTGLYLVSDEVTLSDTTIEGYNNAGVFIAPFDSGSATVSNVQINNIGRHGIYFVTSDATVTDTTVTNLRQVEAQGENECLTVDRYAAIGKLRGIRNGTAAS